MTFCGRGLSVTRRACLAVVACALLAVTLSCESSQTTDTPEGTVREFVSRIGGFRGADQDAQALFDLLSQRARANLEARAKRYGAASGKKTVPWAMLVPARVIPRFQPQTFTSQVVGKYAMVEIRGVSQDQRAQIPCVLEESRWRVDLVLPELPIPRRRPGLQQ